MLLLYLFTYTLRGSVRGADFLKLALPIALFLNNEDPSWTRI